MRLTLATLVLTTGLLAVFGQARGQGLIGAEVDRSRRPVDLTTEESLAARFRLVEVHPEVTDHSDFELNLFGDSVYVAHIRRRETHGSIRTWIGSVEGRPRSSVVVARHPSGVIFAKIEFDGKSFVIQHKVQDVYSVFELDLTRIPDEGEDDGQVETTTDVDDSSEKERAQGKNSKQLYNTTNVDICSAEATCTDQVIDIMVVYSQAARSAMGGIESTESAIAASVAELNLAAGNTGLGHSFRLALAREVSYSETGNANTDLNALRYAEGVIDDIHVWRDSVGADLVHLVLDTGGCGIGDLTSSATEFSSVRSYSVSDDVCFRFNKTFLHELGHNMGLRHDRYVDAGSTPCNWAHGYVNQAAFGGASNQRWRTVMAYNNQCSDSGFNCSRLAYYSNPANTVTGDSMGIAMDQPGAADAAYLLDRSMCVVADFRGAPPDSVVFASFQQGYGAYDGARDTKINDGAQNTSYGSDVLLQADGCCPDLSTLLYWDISSVPAGATVVSVEVSLSINNTSSATHELYEMRRAWDEATATWNMAQTGNNWQTAGAQGPLDRGTTVLGGVTSLYSGVLTTRFNAAGVAVVQSWIDGSSPNYGFALQDYSSSAGDGLYFDSRETAEVGRHPRLTIRYDPAPATGTDTTKLVARVMLQGPWNVSTMKAELRPHLPTLHPFTGSPWLYAGDDSVSSVDISGDPGVPDFFDQNPTIVDWVMVQLRSGTPPGTQMVEAERAAFVHANGAITDLDGSSNLSFPDLSRGYYHVVIYHRNHLAVMSDSLVDFNSGIGMHDFTSTLSSAFTSGGAAMIELNPTTFGMFAGDVNADKQVTAGDFNTWLTSTKAVLTGYVDADINLDSQCTAQDFNIWLVNTKAAVASQVP